VKQRHGRCSAKTLRTLAVVLVALACLGALVVCAVLLYRLPAPSGFDRRRFEAVVEEVRRRPLRPGEQLALRLGPEAPGPVHLVDAEEELVRGGGAGRVWAARTKEGYLKVVIETSDMGHAGEYGYAYSDVPLTLSPLDTSWSTVDVPGRLNIVGTDARIDDHWWAVLYNLD
jgi:hypothetical protein